MRLVVEQGKLAGHGYDLTRSAIVIGRGRECDIILDEQQVSRQHARLQQTAQGWMLVDLGSTNGTQVNGQPLAAHTPRASFCRRFRIRTRRRPKHDKTRTSIITLVQKDAETGIV